MIESVIWIICVGYSLYFLLLLVGWVSITKHESGLEENNLTFSVIVPVRNEAKHIYNLLSDLSKQSYLQEKFEVIVVDDSSEDNTIHEVNRAVLDFDINIRLIDTVDEHTFKGKKHAITKGVTAAENEFIICTDGDCRLGENWIDQYRQAYQKNDSEMVLGPVAYHPTNSLFGEMQKIEFSALIGLGAASLNLGIPNICNGANLSYKKSLFLELDGYTGNENIPSGDDEFLLQKAYDAYPKRISFHKSFEALCYTDAKTSFSDFFNQRIRWSAKWKFHTSIRMKLWGFFMFIFNLAFVIFTPLIFFTEQTELFLSTLFIKLIIEYVYIYKVNSDLGDENRFLTVIVLQLIYPFYTIFLMISSFLKRYRWKGRLYL